jgi:hypothetical protein
MSELMQASVEALGRVEYASALVRILDQVPDTLRAQLEPYQRTYVDYLSQLLDDAITVGEIRDDLDRSVVLMALFGAMDFAADWYSVDGELTQEDLTIQFVSMVLEGFAVTSPMATALRRLHITGGLRVV